LRPSRGKPVREAIENYERLKCVRNLGDLRRIFVGPLPYIWERR